MLKKINFLWTNGMDCDNIIWRDKRRIKIGVWLSLVERYVRDVEVAGSNPVTPTFRKAGRLPAFFVIQEITKHFLQDGNAS